MRLLDAALLADIVQGERPRLVEPLAPALARQLPSAGLNTTLRLAHFLAQAAYETAYFARIEENLHYSASRIARVWPHLASRAAALTDNAEALANAAYAHRNGNGDEASGDGWRFRGRGLFMLTGRANYTAFGYGADPDCAAEPKCAVESALAFWVARDINSAADKDKIGIVTRLVNGGAEGLAERTVLKHRALRLLQSPD